MKYIITESQNKNLKFLLKQVIKSKGVLMAIKSVNGFDNFVKIMDIDSPMDFLHLFDDLDVVSSIDHYWWTLYRYKPKHNLMIYNRKNDCIYINYSDIWSVLQDKFRLKYNEIQNLIKVWLDEVYNLRGVTPLADMDEDKVGWMRSTI